MASTLHPGVYTQEIPSPARSIEAAATSTTIFVGETERGPILPTLIFNRTEYDRLYGGYLAHTATSAKRLTMAYAMDQFFQNGGTKAYVLRVFGNANRTAAKVTVADPDGGAATRNSPGAGSPPASVIKLVASSAGSWANFNASPAQGLNAIILPSTDAVAGKFRIVVLYAAPSNGTPSRMIVEDFDRLSTDPNDEGYVVDTLKRSLYIRWTPNHPVGTVGTADLDSATTPADEDALFALATATTGFSGGLSTTTEVPATEYDDNLALLDDITDASLLVMPRAARLNEADTIMVYDLYGHGVAYVDNRAQRDLFFIGDMARQKDSQLASEFVAATVKDYNGSGGLTSSPLPTSSFSAVYVPWIISADPAGIGRSPEVALSPSAAMAGLYARTDANRGVWKAPAGVEATLAAVRRFEFDLKDAHQDLLNPRGINCLRGQPGAGPVSWGARTTVPNSEWRYVPVRRTAIFLRVSIYNGIQFAVFEPNDEPLWSALRLTIGGFMDRMFRLGAFAGSTPKDAFFVKCNAETTTAADQLAGTVNILVGFSPLRPAEFVIVKLSQIVNQKA